MKSQILPLLKAASPLVLGALGGVIATIYPVGYVAFCSGGPLA
jgi:hypothetical protein